MRVEDVVLPGGVFPGLPSQEEQAAGTKTPPPDPSTLLDLRSVGLEPEETRRLTYSSGLGHGVTRIDILPLSLSVE